MTPAEEAKLAAELAEIRIDHIQRALGSRPAVYALDPVDEVVRLAGEAFDGRWPAVAAVIREAGEREVCS